MSDNFKFNKSAIEWRRNMVLSYLIKGWSQSDIAKKLELHHSTISLDVQFLREKSKKELESHLSEGLPFMYAKSLEGINTVLRRVSEILESAGDNKTKMECLKLQMELYRSLMSLATDGGLIERIMKTIKVIAPLPGEKIPPVYLREGSEEPAIEEDADIIESLEDIPTEPEEDQKEEE
jgi:hypothetical protein